MISQRTITVYLIVHHNKQGVKTTNQLIAVSWNIAEGKTSQDTTPLLFYDYLNFLGSYQLEQKCKYTNRNKQIHSYKYTNTNTQIQIHKYKYTDTNTQIKIHKYKYKKKSIYTQIHTHNCINTNTQKKKYTNTNIWIQIVMNNLIHF